MNPNIEKEEFSRKSATKFLVNGTICSTQSKSLPYSDIVIFAGLKGNPSMTCHARKGEYSMDKIISPGEDIPIIEGMRFEVQHTGNA